MKLPNLTENKGINTCNSKGTTATQQNTKLKSVQPPVISHRLVYRVSISEGSITRDLRNSKGLCQSWSFIGVSPPSSWGLSPPLLGHGAVVLRNKLWLLGLLVAAVRPHLFRTIICSWSYFRGCAIPIPTTVNLRAIFALFTSIRLDAGACVSSVI
jgi:hypothetical protein